MSNKIVSGKNRIQKIYVFLQSSSTNCATAYPSKLVLLENKPHENQHPSSFNSFIKLLNGLPFNDTIQIDKPLMKRFSTIE